MINSDSLFQLTHDIKSQIVVLKVIMQEIEFIPESVAGSLLEMQEAEQEVGSLRYFVRQYFDSDRLDEIIRLKNEHSGLIESILTFDLASAVEQWRVSAKEKPFARKGTP